MNETIRVLCCGGTIDKVYCDALDDYAIGEPQAAHVLREANLSLGCTIQSLLTKDSLDIDASDRELIYEAADSAEESRLLVTHGTDTMIETAKCLQPLVGKTIVLTGSMAPARFRDSDAVFNLGFALGLVQTLPRGVYIAMHGRILDPETIRKNRETKQFELC